MKIDKRQTSPATDARSPKRSFETLLRGTKKPVAPKPEGVGATRPGAPIPAPAKAAPETKRPAVELAPVTLTALLAPSKATPTLAVHMALLADRKLVDARGLDALIGRGREQSERFDSVLALAHVDTRATAEGHESVHLRDRLFETLERQAKGGEPAGQKAPDDHARTDAANPNQQVAGTERTTAPQPSREAGRSESVMAMVEKIELVLKNQSPGLSLELRSSAAAHLEVTRTGPKEVAIVMKARGAAERRELEKSGELLRTALAGRGVQVKLLQIV